MRPGGSAMDEKSEVLSPWKARGWEFVKKKYCTFCHLINTLTPLLLAALYGYDAGSIPIFFFACVFKSQKLVSQPKNREHSNAPEGQPASPPKDMLPSWAIGVIICITGSTMSNVGWTIQKYSHMQNQAMPQHMVSVIFPFKQQHCSC
jgi:hypothetical protein